MRSRKRYKVPELVKIFILVIILLISSLLTRCVSVGDIRLETSGQEISVPSMATLFEIAMEPVGTTMYIWGGGWDSDNERAGKSATQLGLSSRWKEFADEQGADYDFEEHRYESENGLDCSGYIGWVIYNLFEKENGQDGYVTFSTTMAEDFASRGWGKLVKNPHKFLPGDIVSMQGHVWLSLGTCEDGSVLLVHSSPPGVSVCGTAISDTQSIAATLAEEYMLEKHPDWQEKYPSREVPYTYLEEVVVFRWDEDTLEDVFEYQSMTGEQMMEFLNEI